MRGRADDLARVIASWLRYCAAHGTLGAAAIGASCPVCGGQARAWSFDQLQQDALDRLAVRVRAGDVIGLRDLDARRLLPYQAGRVPAVRLGHSGQ